MTLAVGGTLNTTQHQGRLKKYWVAVLLPTHPKRALAFLRIFFLFLFSNSVNKPFFKIIKSCILIEERLQRLILPYIQHL